MTDARLRPRPMTASVIGLVLTLLAPAGGAGADQTAAPRPAAGPAAMHARGPALQTDREKLAQSVRCSAKARPGNPRRTVVLVHGTGSTGHESWSWSYKRALRADGFGVCTVDLPDRGLGSFTRSAEYVVHAVRRAARRSGRDVSLIGHSQGGSLSVWVTEFWPDVARKVEDVISIAGPLNGTEFADNLCSPGRCTPLAWQSRTNARTLDALRGATLSPTTDYTSIVTIHDEIVYPQPRAGRMPGVKLVVAQDVCAADPVEHGLILGDPVTYAVALDALTHRGSARPQRLPGHPCRESFIPNGDPAGSAVFLQTLASFATGLLDPGRMIAAEPRLPKYARAAAR